MRLYITPTSPFARMVRIVIHENALADRVEVLRAQTRQADSPYYTVNPSGRVPYLVLDDGRAFEESQVICAYLDHLDGAPRFDHPAGDAGWEPRRLEALARSLMDGLSVWNRELHRPPDERSPTIIEHERRRSLRLAALWETEIGHPAMTGDLNMPQITLISALQLERLNPGIDWRTGHPGLAAWEARLGVRPSVRDTLPPDKRT